MTIGDMNKLFDDMRYLRREFTAESERAEFRNGQAWKSCDIAQTDIEIAIEVLTALENFLKSLDIKVE